MVRPASIYKYQDGWAVLPYHSSLATCRCFVFSPDDEDRAGRFLDDGFGYGAEHGVKKTSDRASPAPPDDDYVRLNFFGETDYHRVRVAPARKILKLYL